MTVQERFDAKYIPEPNSGCWLWDGAMDADGYGRISAHGKSSALAHRVSYELHLGPVPEGMCICHKCDVPGCVNPQHLFAGTSSDNAMDRNAKDRQFDTRGSGNGRANLSESDIPGIRSRIAAGESPAKIARDHGVTRRVIWLVKTGKAWVHA